MSKDKFNVYFKHYDRIMIEFVSIATISGLYITKQRVQFYDKM